MDQMKTVSPKVDFGLIGEWIACLKGPQLEINNPRVVEWGFGMSGKRKLVHVDVKNRRTAIARHCHASISILTRPHTASDCRESYPLHGAFLPDHPQSGTEGPMDIGHAQRRLDIVYTDMNQDGPGCWVGHASCADDFHKDYFLPPGDYEIELFVKPESKMSPAIKKRFVLRSPKQWDQLKIFHR